MAPLDDEDLWIGVESHLVPKADPTKYCNAKKVVSIVGGDLEGEDLDPEVEKGIVEHNDLDAIRDGEERVYFRGFCNNPAGKGTEQIGEGRCKYHNGNGGGAMPGNGAPNHNQNAQTHAGRVDPHHYHENLPLEEKEFIENFSAALEDRIRKNHGRDPDYVDKVLCRSVAINLHLFSKSRDYSKDEMVQTIIHDGSSHEEKGALVDEVRRYSNSLFSNLKDLGVLDDPESQKADAVEDWRNFLEQGAEKVDTDS